MKRTHALRFASKLRLSASLGTATQCFRSLLREEDGQDLVEYSLLLGFLAVGSMAALHSAGSTVKSFWQAVSNDLSSAVTAAS